MDDPAVFTEFLRNTLGVTTQQKIDKTTNFVESFGGLLVANYRNIDTFVKDTHSVNNFIASAQITLIRNNVTQGLKPFFLKLKNIEFCNAFPDEISLCGINAYQIIIMKNNRSDTK